MLRVKVSYKFQGGSVVLSGNSPINPQGSWVLFCSLCGSYVAFERLPHLSDAQLSSQGVSCISYHEMALQCSYLPSLSLYLFHPSALHHMLFLHFPFLFELFNFLKILYYLFLTYFYWSFGNVTSCTLVPPIFQSLLISPSTPQHPREKKIKSVN